MYIRRVIYFEIYLLKCSLICVPIPCSPNASVFKSMATHIHSSITGAFLYWIIKTLPLLLSFIVFLGASWVWHHSTEDKNQPSFSSPETAEKTAPCVFIQLEAVSCVVFIKICSTLTCLSMLSSHWYWWRLIMWPGGRCLRLKTA